MKKIICLALAFTMMTSCATLLTSNKTKEFKNNPEYKKKIKVGCLVGDILTGGLWVIVDLATGNIFKYIPKEQKK